MDGRQIFRAELAKILAGGSGAGGHADAAGSFVATATAIAKRDGCAMQDALRKARIEHPAEFEAMQRADAQPIGARPDPAPIVIDAARQRFVEKAQEVAKRDQLPLHLAMSAVRKQHPELVAQLG